MRWLILFFVILLFIIFETTFLYVPLVFIITYCVALVSTRENKYWPVFLGGIIYDAVLHNPLSQTAIYFLISMFIVGWVKYFFPNKLIISGLLYILLMLLFFLLNGIFPLVSLVIVSIISFPFIYFFIFWLLSPLEETQLKFDFVNK